MKCKARQYSDQKVCHDCRLVWDVNDPYPPKGKCDTNTVEEDRINVALENVRSQVAVSKEEIKL